MVAKIAAGAAKLSSATGAARTHQLRTLRAALARLTALAEHADAKGTLGVALATVTDAVAQVEANLPAS